MPGCIHFLAGSVSYRSRRVAVRAGARGRGGRRRLRHPRGLGSRGGVVVRVGAHRNPAPRRRLRGRSSGLQRTKLPGGLLPHGPRIRPPPRSFERPPSSV